MNRHHVIRALCVAAFLFTSGCASSGFLGGLWNKDSSQEQAVKHDEYGNAVLDEKAKPKE